jgi:hypothetical protein
MATRRLSPPKRRPSLAQLAYGIVTEAFGESFETFLKATIKHHPRSRSYPRQFLRAWRAKLEWAERSQAINERACRERKAERDQRRTASAEREARP